MKLKTILLGLIIAAGSVLGNAADDVAGFTRYENSNRQIKAEPNTGSRVVFLGNSITDFWIGQSPEFFTLNDFIDRGISGQTTYQFQMRFREDVINLQPAAVVINGGTNDVAENMYTYNADRTFGNIVSMVELAQANNIKVFLASVLPAASFGWNPRITDAPDKIAALNERIKAYAEAHDIPYIDYYSEMVFGSERALNPAYTGDGVHPNKAGYKVMEGIVLPIIRKYVNLDSTVPDAVSLEGDAIVEEASVECSKVSVSRFEAFVELKAGKTFTARSSDGKTYAVAGDKLVEGGSEGDVIAKDGVYCVSLDFLAKAASVKEVNSFSLFYCIDNKRVADFEYAGRGVWKGEWKCHLTTADWGKDTRYRFSMTIDGKEQCWGPLDDNEDGEPDGTEAYFNMKRTYPVSQWDNKWKFPVRYNGKNLLFTVTMRGTYTHRVRQASDVEETVAESAPRLVSVNGADAVCHADTLIYDVNGVLAATGVSGATLRLPAGIYIASANGQSQKFSVN